MNGRPVFNSRLEAEEWEAVRRIEGAKDQVKALTSVLDRVLGNDQVHSAILTELIGYVARSGSEDWEAAVKELTEKRRPQDNRPVIAAAKCYADLDKGDKAMEYLDQISGATDIPATYLVKAKADLFLKKDGEAVTDLLKVLGSDPTNDEAYALLENLQPDKDWANVRAYEMLAAGKDVDEPPDNTTREHDLYRIYREWFRGTRTTATSLLLATPEYGAKDPDYCLLSARMSVCEEDWHSAQSMYEEALRGKAGNVAVLCEAADAYAKDGEYEKALAHFRDAEAADPGSPRVARGLIGSYMGIGRSAEALELVKDFLQSEMADYEDFVRFSEALLKAGYTQEAVAYAGDVLLTYPGDAPACVVMSRAAVSEGDLDSAASYARIGLKANRKNADVLAQMSRVSLASRQVGKAIKYAKRANKADPDSVPALLALMEAYRETGDHDKTKEVCRSVLELDPDNSEASNILSKIELEQALSAPGGSTVIMPSIAGEEDFVNMLSSLVAEKKYAEAEKLCADNDSKYGGLAIVRRLRGNAEYARGEFMKASASFASAAALDPSAEIWYSKGMADEAFGDLESAEGAYDKAVLLNTKEPKYWISKGCVQESRGDRVGAVESFNHAIELDPGSAYALARKAVILAETSRYTDALSFIDLAEATDPGNEGIMKIRMKICLAAGKYTDAVYLGKKLLKSNKKEPDDTVVCCVVQADIGISDTASAKKLVERAMADNPDSVRLMEAARDLYVTMGDNELTISICRKLLKVSPYDRKTRKALADALSKSGKGEEAASIYDSLENEKEEKPAEDGDKDAGSMQDPDAIIAVARSLLEADDTVGAGRMADRALAADPNNTDYILFRASVYRRTGDLRIAEAFLSQSIMRNPSSAALYEAAADLRSEQGDYKGAVEGYGNAVKYGLKKPSMYVKMGVVQQRMGSEDAAANSFRTALMLDPHDAEAGRLLASLQIRKKEYEAALKTIGASIENQPCAEAYALLARICQGLRDREGVGSAYANFVKYDDASEEDSKAVITALNSVGLRTEANTLKARVFPDEAPEVEVDPAVKRCSERIMRRAYMQGLEVSDPSIVDMVAASPELAKQAVDYLQALPDYGEVMVGTTDFERMERLSHNVIARGKVKDLELVTVEAAYVAGGAKDSDEAKLLLAYMRACRTSKLPREIPEQYRKAAKGVSPKDSVEQVMMDCSVGVFGARMIMACVD